MVQLIGRKALNRIVAHLPECKDGVHKEAKQIGRRAEANLAAARGSTHWHKIHGPSHTTRISVSQGEVDSFVNMDGEDPMAIEFGHAPSGVFGKGGEFGHLETKAPHGLYILTSAAGTGDLHLTPNANHGKG
jgi:hypothetical protein